MTASAKPRPVSPDIEDEGLIGQQALKDVGYHLVMTR